MEISPVNFCVLLASLIGMSVGYIIQETCNCQTEKICSWASDGSPTPRQTGRLTVGRKLTWTSSSRLVLEEDVTDQLSISIIIRERSDRGVRNQWPLKIGKDLSGNQPDLLDQITVICKVSGNGLLHVHMFKRWEGCMGKALLEKKYCRNLTNLQILSNVSARINFHTPLVKRCRYSKPFQPHIGPGVDSVPNKMSTRIIPGGVWRPVLKAGNLTAVCEPVVRKMWEPWCLAAL
jgi:hypothetical protein